MAAQNYLVICGCINPNIPEPTGSEAEAPEYWLKGQICPCALLGLRGEVLCNNNYQYFKLVNFTSKIQISRKETESLPTLDPHSQMASLAQGRSDHSGKPSGFLPSPAF